MSETDCVTELELKLAVPDAAVLDALPGVLEESGCRLRDLGVRVVHDRYLDTQDWRLYRAGFGCRLRTQDGSAAVLTLKELTRLEDGWAERLEWEEPLPEPVAPLPGPLPGKEIASRFAPALAGKPLDEVVKLVKKQQAFEVTDDAVTIHVTVDRVEAGDKLFSEIELELITGDRERFLALAEEVRLKLVLSPSAADKFSLALIMSGITPPERNGGITLDFKPEDRFVEAAYRVMSLHYARFLWHEPGTRLGMDPEHLHNMRVATRRLLAALWVFSSAFSAERVAALKRELKWVAKTLGPVRDLDIAVQRIEEEAQDLPAGEKKAVQAYIDYLHDRRGAAQSRVPAALDSDRFKYLKASLDRFLYREPSGQGDATDADLTAARVAPRVFLDSLSTIRNEAKKLSPSSTDKALHAFRRKCKKMRYQAEFFTPLYGKPAKKIAARFVAMQDALGAHQDTVVSNQMLTEFMACYPRQRESGSQLYMALGRIMAQRAVIAHKQRDDFFKAWKRFDRKKNYSKIKKRMKLTGSSDG